MGCLTIHAQAVLRTVNGIAVHLVPSSWGHPLWEGKLWETGHHGEYRTRVALS
jgi:hypothetical protein